MPTNARTIIEEKRFKDELRNIEPNARRADEFIDGAKWILCRNPEAGTRLSDNPPIYFLPIADIQSLPRLVLYYTFNSNHVVFLSLQQSESEANNE